MIPQNLQDLEHFRTDPRVQFKEEKLGGVDVVIPCYMIADAEFWSLPYARELRGHTYLKSTGELIGVAFHKFFNVGEREETQHGNIKWENCADYTFDKMDGSMINPVVVTQDNGIKRVHFKTKKSFYSEVAITFTAWFWEQPQAQVWADGIIRLAEHGFSPIFEFFHPEWQIVLNYGDEPKVWWLNTRRHDNGDYYDGLTDNPLPGMNKAPMEVWDVKGQLVKRQEEVVNVEGWIVYDYRKCEFYKVKTKWYLQQHRVRTELRERDVAELAALEKLDDVKSIVSAAGLDLSKIEVIEKNVAWRIGTIRREVEEAVELGYGWFAQGTQRQPTAKEMAEAFKENPLFGLIMTKFRGKEPNYVEYFLRNHLKPVYGLKNVYNEKF